MGLVVSVTNETVLPARHQRALSPEYWTAFGLGSHWSLLHLPCISWLFIQLSDSASLWGLVLPRWVFLSALSTCVLSWIVFSHRDCLLPALISCSSLVSELSCLYCCVWCDWFYCVFNKAANGSSICWSLITVTLRYNLPCCASVIHTIYFNTF